MKKTVSPAVAIAVIVVVVVIAVFLFTRAAKSKRVQFVPGIGVIDSETGRPMRPEGRGPRGRRGAAGAETERAGARGRR